jgi:outer membrane protein assembly factor BamB
VYTTDDNKAMNYCALDVRNGEIVWCSNVAQTSTVTVANGTEVFTAANFEGTVHALQKSNGSQVWQYKVEGTDRRVFGLALER